MTNIPILPERLCWSSAIGLYLINFGTLEYLLLSFLKDHITQDEFESVREWHLKDRAGRITQYLKAKNYPVQEQAAFESLLERLKPIRKLRNRIAHGHLYLTKDPETQKVTVTLLQAKDLDTGHLQETKRIELGELEAELGKLSSLIEDFQAFSGFKQSGVTLPERD